MSGKLRSLFICPYTEAYTCTMGEPCLGCEIFTRTANQIELSNSQKDLIINGLFTYFTDKGTLLTTAKDIQDHINKLRVVIDTATIIKDNK